MKRFIRILIDIFFRVFWRLESAGQEFLPAGPVILAPNHNHLLDPLLIAAVYRPDLTAVAKIELSENRLIRWIFGPLDVISIDREGNDLKSIREAIDILKRMSLIVFPEGTRNYSLDPLPGKPGVPLMARQAKVLIVPVVISGNYKMFSRMRVEFLAPVEISDYEFERLNSQAYQSIADDILGRVYQRKQELEYEDHHR